MGIDAWSIVEIVGTAVVALNAIVTVRLWRSGIYEQSQKAVQTALVWLIPGSFAIVNWFLRGPTRPRQHGDTTTSRDHDDFVGADKAIGDVSHD